METIAEAFRQQASNIKYPDYENGEDFTLWISGYRERIRNAFGFNVDQDDNVNAEVVRSISGKLEVGTPLDTYNDLTPEVKADYGQLVKELIKEFIDPQMKTRFEEKLDFNKRKNGQSIKEFMQEIKKDQNRYLDMDDMIGIGAAATTNTAKVQDGVRRFLKGMRDRKGYRNTNLTRHLKTEIHYKNDMTWEKALDAACRWEAAYDFSETDSEADDDDGPKTAAIIGAIGDSPVLSALMNKVDKNAKDIEGLRESQKALETNMAEWKKEIDSNFDQIQQFLSSLCIEDETPE